MSYSAFLLHDGLLRLAPWLAPHVEQRTAQHSMEDMLTVEQVRCRSAQHLVHFIS